MKILFDCEGWFVVLFVLFLKKVNLKCWLSNTETKYISSSYIQLTVAFAVHKLCECCY